MVIVFKALASFRIYITNSTSWSFKSSKIKICEVWWKIIRTIGRLHPACLCLHCFKKADGKNTVVVLGARDTLGFQSIGIVKAHLWACFQKSSSQLCLLTSLLPQASKVSFWFNAKLSNCVRHAEEKRRKRKERRKGHSALSEKSWNRELKHREIFSHLRYSPNENIERNAVRVWESEKEKKGDIFSVLKLYTKKINWWSSLRVFECYNYGELECSKEDFAAGFVVRLYLLLEIYLLYIQFIVDSSLA